MGDVQKSTKKCPQENSSTKGRSIYNLELGDNAKITAVCLKTLSLPKININDCEAVEKRLMEYFKIYMEADMKPTVSGMAMALGYTRQWLYDVVHNKPIGIRGGMPSYPKSVVDVIRSAYRLLECQWEEYMLSGKINPVTGIFFGTNHYKYQNKAEHVITPNVQEEEYTTEDIKNRYITEKRQK